MTHPVPKRPRVLLAEDHRELAKAVSRVPDWTARSWEMYRTAARCWKPRRRQPDVIVVDLHLPNVNGLSYVVKSGK